MSEVTITEIISELDVFVSAFCCAHACYSWVFFISIHENTGSQWLRLYSFLGLTLLAKHVSLVFSAEAHLWFCERCLSH